MEVDSADLRFYIAFFWTNITISVVIALQFLIGGYYRHKVLEEIGFSQRRYQNFSRLQKTKMILFFALIAVDATILIA